MSSTVLKGPASPFRRDGNSDFTAKEGLDLIKANVAQVLGTREGELPWRPLFGSKLHRILHSAGPSVAYVAQYYVVQALERWCPYIRLRRFTAELRDGTLYLTISYRVVNTGLTVTDQTLPIQP